MAGLAAGALLGGLQWRLLRCRFARGRRDGRLSGWGWVGASALGFGVSFTVAWALSGGVAGAEYGHHGLPHAVDRAATWGGMLIATMLGAAQGLALRVGGSPGARRQAGWYTLVSGASFAAAWWVAAMASAPVEAALGPMTHFWGGAVFGVVFGALTGIGLLWRTRRPRFSGSL